MYIDLHTHNPQQEKNCIRIVNSCDITPAGNTLFSAGLHPWDITTGWEKEFSCINEIATHPQVVAIGECGIDKIKKTASAATQEDALAAHALLAEEVKKPLILHCVKGTEEIIALHRKIHPQQAWIIHGFRGKPEQAALVYIFGLIVKMAESGYIDQGYVRSELKTGLTNIVNANDLASVKLGDDAMKYTENAIDTFTDDTLEKTYENLDDPWYLSDERATYIAANSTNSLRNLDDYIIAKKSGKKKKRWVTKMDLRVRKTHKITNGKLVDIDKPFVIGTSRLMFPCDTSLGASMSEIANCRCVCKYE